MICLGVAAAAGLLSLAVVWDGVAESATEEITFSRPSGFYDDAFYLEIKGDGNPIYYTLDSSDPDERSTLYDGPILIQDATPNENLYSVNKEVSLYCAPDSLTQNKLLKSQKYLTPEAPVDKATVVRAASIGADGKCGPVATAVYFVGFGEKKGYAGLNIMAITTDPANLFDYEKGIYVLGKTFYEYLQDADDQDRKTRMILWPANYRQEGRDWEREANVQCFDSQGDPVFSGPCGIRIQGRATRARLPKNLNIYARKEYGCAGFNTGGLFSGAYTLKRLSLVNGSNDLMLKDYLVNEMIDGMNLINREFCPCALFLDGEYWGVYWLCSRFKADYLSQEYGVKPDNIVGIKTNEVEIGEADDLKLYEDMIAYIADNDMRTPEAFERACEMIDLQSFIDYYAVEIYIANSDWPTNNYVLWRTRKKASGPYSDGRWRWVPYDMDLSLREKYVEQDDLKRVLNVDPVFASLMQNGDVYRMLVDRLLRLATDTFAPERTDAFIDDFEARMGEAIEKKYQRFYEEYSMQKKFYGSCEDVKKFFRMRQAFVIKTYGGKYQ